MTSRHVSIASTLITFLLIAYPGLAQEPPAPSASAANAVAAPSASAANAAPSASAASPSEAEAPAADIAATDFAARCSGCHTVGGGKLSGPDLLPSSQYSDTELRNAIKLMEKRVGPLANQQVDAFAALLKDPRARDRITAAQRDALAKMESAGERASPAVGAALFHGHRPLSGGGIACVTCHRVSGQGGDLGPDLTAYGSRVQGAPLVSAVQNASFNVMRATYRDHPISKQEATHIGAFLETIDPASAKPESAPVGLAAIAFGSLAFAGIVIALRPRPGVRNRLLRRAMRR